MPTDYITVPEPVSQLVHAYVSNKLTIEEFEHWIWEHLNGRPVYWFRFGMPDPELVSIIWL